MGDGSGGMDSLGIAVSGKIGGEDQRARVRAVFLSLLKNLERPGTRAAPRFAGGIGSTHATYGPGKGRSHATYEISAPNR